MKKVISIVAVVVFTLGLFATQAETILEVAADIEHALACGDCDSKDDERGSTLACGDCDSKDDERGSTLACGDCDSKDDERGSTVA